MTFLRIFQFLNCSLHHFLQLISRYSDRLVDVLQRPFHHGVILWAANEQPDARIVAFTTQKMVGCCDVKIKFACKLGNELYYLLLYHHIAF